MKRILLKLSGEALGIKEENNKGFYEPAVREVARQIKTIHDQGTQIGIVIGGGNFWRGRSSGSMDRTRADQIGMLATVMNCIYVADMLHQFGMETEVMTPFAVGAFTSLFSRDRALECLEKGKVVFFAGGTGHPYFSTDTATVLRAVEMEAEAILLAKAVDGVYDKDPKEDPSARKYDRISLTEVLEKNLKVIDLTASIMAKENHMPLVVFALGEENSIVNALSGKYNGTFVTAD